MPDETIRSLAEVLLDGHEKLGETIYCWCGALAYPCDQRKTIERIIEILDLPLTIPFTPQLVFQRAVIRPSRPEATMHSLVPPLNSSA